MAVDFPNSPNTGQVFTEGNISWRYNGYAWQRIPDPGEKGQPGIKGTKGDIGPQGPIGNFGGATFQYQFNSATDDSDPGDGKLKLSSGTVSSATKLFIDDKDGGDTNTDIQPFLRTIADSTSTIKGHFRISNKNIADDFALFTISAIEEATGSTYFKVTCAHVSGSASSFDNNEDIIITFARTGDQGQKGEQGIQGIPGTPINYDLEVTNGTTTISLKGSNGTTDNVQLVGSGAVSITRDSATQLTITGTNTQKSEEEIEDIVGGMINTTTGITVTYDDNASGGDGAGKLNFVNTIDDFTDLNDTPANYTGQAHKFVRVNKPNASNNDGNGLEFATPLNTTYALSATQKDDGTNPGSPDGTNDDPFLFLDGSSGTDSHIQIKGSGTVSVARNSTGDEITISGSDTNVNTQYSISVEAGDDASAEKLRLSGTNSVDDDVLFKAGTGLAISKQTSGADLIQYDGTYELHALATGDPATASDPDIALMSDSTSAVTNGSIQLVGEGGVTVTRDGTTKIKINGSGAGTNTTYSIKASQKDDGTNPGSPDGTNDDPFLFLDASQGTDAHIQLKGSNSAKVERNANDEITISSTSYTLGTADGSGSTEKKITLSKSGGGDTTDNDVILVQGSGIEITRSNDGKITFANADKGSDSNNTFIGLSDVTPSNYTGHAHKLVRVNKDGTTNNGTGLEFIEEADYTFPLSGTNTGANNSGSFGNGRAIFTLKKTVGSTITDDKIEMRAGANINIDRGTSDTIFTISAQNTEGPNTEYLLKALPTGSPATDGDPKISLEVDGGNEADSVQLVGSNSAKVERDDDGKITISSTTYTLGTADGDGATEKKITLSKSGGGDTTDNDVILVQGSGIEITRSSDGKITFKNDDKGSDSNNTFIGLSDVTPSNYTGHAHKLVRVNKPDAGNNNGNGLEFIEERIYSSFAGGTDSNGFGNGNATITLRDSFSNDNDDTITINAGSNIKIERSESTTAFTISAQNTEGPNTEYLLKALPTGSPATDGDPKISLEVDGGNEADSVQLVGSGTVSVERDNDGQITISGTDTNVNTTYTLPVSGSNTTGGAGNYGSGEAILTLTGTNNTTDPVKIKAGSNINLLIDSTNGEFTISAKDTNTQIPDTTYDLLVVQTGSPANNSNPAIKLDASSGDDDQVQLAAVDYSGLTITKDGDSTINFNTSLLLEARSSTNTATDTANPNLTLATHTSSTVPVLDTVKFIGGDNISVARNTNSNEITISSSANIDITQLDLNRIRFGPGNAGSDDANIEWRGGNNEGYLRISVSDDSDDSGNSDEYIEIGDYANTNIGGDFTQWLKLARDEITLESIVRTKDDLYIDEGLRDGDGDIGTSGQVLTSTGSKTNWVNASTVGGSVDTKYDLLVPANTTKIRLEGNTESGNVNDDVEIAAGTNITVTRDGANKLTIASSATLTGTIDKANQIKVDESPGNSANSTYHNLTYVANSTGGNHQTLLMDDETSRLSWNPYLERLIAFGVWSYRMIQWSNGSAGSAGQVLTSQGSNSAWTWTTPSSGLSIGNESSSTYRNLVFIDSSSASSLKTNDNDRLQVRSSDGAVRVKGDITAFYSSDTRLKKNISPIKNALDKVSLISGNTFEWNENSLNEGEEVGVLAQEIEKLGLPNVVTTRENGYKAVRYEKLVPLLIEAIKELKDEIDDLKRN